MGYTEPGSPWPSGFAESFHGGSQVECLNQEQLWTLTEARRSLRASVATTSTRGRTAALGYESPSVFAAGNGSTRLPENLTLARLARHHPLPYVCSVCRSALHASWLMKVLHFWTAPSHS
jgi:hypothetical protein